MGVVSLIVRLKKFDTEKDFKSRNFIFSQVISRLESKWPLISK